MGTNLTTTVLFSVISLVIGIIIGEPLKHIFNTLFAKTDNVKNQKSIIKSLKKKMPDLISEMKRDLLSHPLNREFILMKKNWAYNGDAISYFFEDHVSLQEKIDILENYQLISNITNNNVSRYKMTEEFIEMLNKYK